MKYALLLMLCGCGGASHAYMDGAPLAPVEPRTIYTPNGAGLPEYWGQPAPPVERSPHARVLPETPETRREPGIWAGDAPKARPRIMDLLVPAPEDIHGDGLPIEAQQMCADVVTEDLGKVSKAVARLSPLQRACLAAHAHYRCLQWLDHSLKKQPRNDLTARMADALLTAAAASAGWADTLCKALPNNPDPAVFGALRDIDTIRATKEAPKWKN